MALKLPSPGSGRRPTSLPPGALRWARVFSCEHDSPAHLIGSEWLTRRACSPELVNSQLAKPANGHRLCETCAHILANAGASTVEAFEP